MSDKFSVGSIEEDFKRIGLISEVVLESTVGPISEEISNVVENSDNKAETPEANEGVKLLRKKRPTGKLRIQRRKQKMLRRRNKGKLKLKAKKFRRSARGKRFLRKYKQALKRFHGHAPKGKRVSLRMGLDRVSSMLEDVQEIVNAIDNTEKQETIRSFANLALIANKLAESYAFASSNVEVQNENNEEIDLHGGAVHFESLANAAADLAEALQASIQEGAEFEGTAEEVADTFGVMLADVLEGLDLFADLSEGDDTDEAITTRTSRELTPDDEEEEETEDKKDDSDNDDDDDDDDDDKDSDDSDDEVDKDSDDDDVAPDNTSNVDDDDKDKEEGAIGTAIGAGLGALAGGPVGAALGGAAGHALSDEEEDKDKVKGKKKVRPTK